MPKLRAIGFPGIFNDGEPLEKSEMIKQLVEDATAYFHRGDIAGILFYGDNHIFHYLEATTSYMPQLKKAVLDYPLFHGQMFIYDQEIPYSKFSSWQVRYVRNEPLVQDFMAQHGWQQFDPYLLKGELLAEFMNIVALYADGVDALAPPLSDLVAANPAEPPEPLFISAKKKWPYYVLAATGLSALAGWFFIYL